MSKAFGKVWHDGLLFKLQRNGIEYQLFQLFKSYLSNRKQRVVINGFEFEWGLTEAGVPQGSVFATPPLSNLQKMIWKMESFRMLNFLPMLPLYFQ